MDRKLKLLADLRTGGMSPENCYDGVALGPSRALAVLYSDLCLGFLPLYELIHHDSFL